MDELQTKDELYAIAIELERLISRQWKVEDIKEILQGMVDRIVTIAISIPPELQNKKNSDEHNVRF